jgi:hypothetical protein
VGLNICSEEIVKTSQLKEKLGDCIFDACVNNLVEYSRDWLLEELYIFRISEEM